MAYSTKLYADNRCIAEFFSANELREMAGHDTIEHKEEKKIYSCPNCGAPISGYICEYCGTKLVENNYEEEMIEQLSKKHQELVDKLARLELENSQHTQSVYLQSTLNAYSIQDRLYSYQNQPFQSSYLYDQLQNQICCTRDQINAQIAQTINCCQYTSQLKNEGSPLSVSNESNEEKIPTFWQELEFSEKVLFIIFYLFLFLASVLFGYSIFNIIC